MQTRIPGHVAATLLAAALASIGQTPPAAPPAFEVATVKPSPSINPQAIMSGQAHLGMKVDAGRVDIGFMSLSDLICTAYAVKAYQVTGPDWIKAERFDIVAKMPEGAAKEQVPEMLKTLLAERFRLVAHHEGKEHLIYSLVVAKGGSKLKPSPADAPSPPVDPPVTETKDKNSGATINVGNDQMHVTRGEGGKMVMSGGPNGKQTMTMGQDGMMHMEIEKITMAKFAETLSTMAGRPVVDKTGLQGTYQVALDLSLKEIQNAARAAGIGMPGMGPGGGGAPESAAPADAASDPSGGGSVFTSLQQLGLRLEPKKDQMDGLVIDRVEKEPTEN